MVCRLRTAQCENNKCFQSRLLGLHLTLKKGDLLRFNNHYHFDIKNFLLYLISPDGTMQSYGRSMDIPFGYSVRPWKIKLYYSGRPMDTYGARKCDKWTNYGQSAKTSYGRPVTLIVDILWRRPLYIYWRLYSPVKDSSSSSTICLSLAFILKNPFIPSPNSFRESSLVFGFFWPLSEIKWQFRF